MKDRVDREDWRYAALAVVYDLCQKRERFYVDDVWHKFVNDHGEHFVTSVDMRALGAVMAQARSLKWCQATRQYRRVVGAHHHLRPVWSSLIIGQAQR